MGRGLTKLSLIFCLCLGLLNACARLSPNSSEPNNFVEETEDTLTKIRQRDKIIIGVSTDSPPFAFLDSEGRNVGLEIDIARFITKQILGSVEKVQFVPIFEPSKRVEFLKTNKIDLAIASIRDLPQNKTEIDLSRHYYSSGFSFLTRKNNGINSWQQLKGHKVCGIRGGYWNQALSRMGFELIDFRSFDEVKIALKEQNCIGLVSSHSEIASILQDPEWSEQWHQALPLILSVPWSMGLPKGDDSFKKAINEAILTMESKGFLVTREAQWKITPTGYVQKKVAQAETEIGIRADNSLQDLTIDDSYEHNILIDGSRIISPLSDRIAAKFVSNNEHVKIVVGRSGTDEGFRKLCKGEIDIANASREMNQTEMALCSANGIEYVEVPFGFDGIAIAVHRQNDWIDCLKLSELSKIWGNINNQTLENWNQVSDRYPTKKLQLFGKPINSETTDYFTTALVGDDGTIRDNYRDRQEDSKIIQDIAQNPQSLGFFSFKVNNTEQDTVKIVSVMNQKGRCVQPNEISLGDGNYNPLSRPLYFYVSQQSLSKNFDVQDFSNYFLAKENRFEIVSVGYVPLPQNSLKKTRDRLQTVK